MSHSASPKFSRRDFLKAMGAGAAAVAASSYLARDVRPALAGVPTAQDSWGMLVDVTRCTGCNSCTLACKAANHLPNPGVVANDFASDAYTYIDVRQKLLSGTLVRTDYVKRQCMHCLHPACVSACTVGALSKLPTGPVVYDARKCFGCRYCQYACPFGVPAYEWGNPLGLIHKCQFCVSRLDAGAIPACVEACPTGALHFGKREGMLQQARALIASYPDRYLNHIYGEKEVGGTSVLYLASLPFTELGFSQLGTEPVSRYAEPVMGFTPVTAVTVATLATVLYWLRKRREGTPVYVHSDKIAESEQTQ